MKTQRGFLGATFMFMVVLLLLAPLVVSPAQAQGICGSMDIAVLLDNTVSMGTSLDIIKLELVGVIDQAVDASGGNLTLGYISFGNTVQVQESLTTDTESVLASLQEATAGGGGNTPEASDEALNTAVNNLAQRPGQTGDFTTPWRDEALKIIILITDAEPGGFDDEFEEGIDDVAMQAHAAVAAERGIMVSVVFVPTSGGYAGQGRIMREVAETTGGTYIQTLIDGTGTANAIDDIVAQCGVAPPVPKPDAVSAVAGISLAGIVVGLLGQLGSVAPQSMQDVVQYFLEGVVETKGEVRVKMRPTRFYLTGPETLSLAFAAVTLGLAFAYGLAPSLDEVITLLPLGLATAVAIELFKELARELTARRTGNWSEYRVWPLGFVAMAVSTALFKAPFAVPGKSWFHMENPSKRNEGLIATSSSVAGLLTAGLFYLVFLAGMRDLGALGLSISLALALFELIPMNPLNGKDVYDWNRRLWAGLFSLTAVLYAVHLLFLG